ncbi:hypothetical protein BN871_CR_00240, partial [Paenibacillus sp. P22]
GLPIAMTFDPLYHPHPSYRLPTYSRNGMVATSQPLAAQAGLDILKKGGNAIDAAIAAAAALTVVEPCSNGIGGDAFALVWTEGRLHGLNSSGPAPASISIDAVKERGHSEMPKFGAIPVTVPGAPAAWGELSRRFGKLPLIEALEPAIRYAEEGFPVSPTAAYYWERAARTLPGEAASEYSPLLVRYVRSGRQDSGGGRAVALAWTCPGVGLDRRVGRRQLLSRRARGSHCSLCARRRRISDRGGSRRIPAGMGGPHPCELPRLRGVGNAAERPGADRAAGAQHFGRNGVRSGQPARSGGSAPPDRGDEARIFRRPQVHYRSGPYEYHGPGSAVGFLRGSAPGNDRSAGSDAGGGRAVLGRHRLSGGRRRRRQYGLLHPEQLHGLRLRPRRAGNRHRAAEPRQRLLAGSCPCQRASAR